jgi:hypothetical protein
LPSRWRDAAVVERQRELPSSYRLYSSNSGCFGALFGRFRVGNVSAVTVAAVRRNRDFCR